MNQRLVSYFIDICPDFYEFVANYGHDLEGYLPWRLWHLSNCAHTDIVSVRPKIVEKNCSGMVALADWFLQHQQRG